MRMHPSVTSYLCLPQLPTQCLPGALSLAVNRLGRHKANISPPPSAKVSNAWSHTYPPPYSFTAGTILLRNWTVSGAASRASLVCCGEEKNLCGRLYVCTALLLRIQAFLGLKLHSVCVRKHQNAENSLLGIDSRVRGLSQ